MEHFFFFYLYIFGREMVPARVLKMDTGAIPFATLCLFLLLLQQQIQSDFQRKSPFPLAPVPKQWYTV